MNVHPHPLMVATACALSEKRVTIDWVNSRLLAVYAGMTYRYSIYERVCLFMHFNIIADIDYWRKSQKVIVRH